MIKAHRKGERDGRCSGAANQTKQHSQTTNQTRQ